MLSMYFRRSMITINSSTRGGRGVNLGMAAVTISALRVITTSLLCIVEASIAPPSPAKRGRYTHPSFGSYVRSFGAH